MNASDYKKLKNMEKEALKIKKLQEKILKAEMEMERIQEKNINVYSKQISNVGDREITDEELDLRHRFYEAEQTIRYYNDFRG